MATDFGAAPAMTLQKIGLGAGSIDLPIPNILRLWLGEATGLTSQSQETIAVLETQIDDLSSQAIGYVFEALFAAGAVDVFTQPIGMKKSRPGILLTVICHLDKVTSCEAVIFRETTTLGIRRAIQQRAILQREIQEVMTEYGMVRVKVAWRGEDATSNVQPEFDDCAQLAKKHNIAWREMHRLALQTWYAQKKGKG